MRAAHTASRQGLVLQLVHSGLHAESRKAQREHRMSLKLDAAFARFIARP